MTTDWDTCARMLGRSLSRYNGLTNSAKLELITNIILEDTEDLFENKPFRYAYDIIREFQKHVEPRSAEVHLHHAIAFGFLHRAVSGGARTHPELVKKVESTSHIALTSLGRALRSAKKLQHRRDDFQRFIWEYALLECDFDMYALLIKTAEENNGNVVELNEFYDRYYKIREKKYQWLMEKFPYVVQRNQIKRYVLWISRCDHKWQWGAPPPRFEGKTPSHHYDQRKRWAQKFRHIDASKRELTEAGRQFSSYLPPTNDKLFFWLGPPSECAQSRFFSATDIPKKQCSPAWNFMRPAPNNNLTSISNEFVDRIALYMEESFEFIRLRDFTQAPLDAVIPYIYFLEIELQERVSEQELFRDIFIKHKNKFVCTLRKNLSQSHYWLRKK